MCSAQYGCFLQFLDFMVSWYVTYFLNVFYYYYYYYYYYYFVQLPHSNVAKLGHVGGRQLHSTGSCSYSFVYS